MSSVPAPLPSPRVALVYDWVTTKYGGAEKVLLALHQAFPRAPLFTAVVDERQADWASTFEIKPSWLQRWPWFHRHHRWAAAFLPLAFESFDLRDYDVVISISSSAAHGVLTKANQLHINYLLTPPRYLYSHHHTYQTHHLRWGLVKSLAAPWLRYLKWWDQTAARRPDIVIPISHLTAQRAADFYQRKIDSPIYPPVSKLVSSSDAQAQTITDDYYLVISRLVPYKRIDLAIQACRQLGRRLVIIGEGPDRIRLQKLANSDQRIQFTGHVSDRELADWVAGCRALLMPGLEDFGIAACEAVAAGKPVILHTQSGAAELLLDQESGIHLREETVNDLVTAIQKLEKTPFQSLTLQQNMRKYATTTFVKKWQTTVNQLWSLKIQKGNYERQ